MTTNAGHFVLGSEGLALLRRWLSGDEAELAGLVRAMAERASAPDAGVMKLRFEAPGLDVAAGYARWSEVYDSAPNPLIRIEEPVVRAMIDACPAGDALDVACGTGRHARHLVARGHRVVGIDSSPEMLEKARAAVPGGDFRTGSLEALPLQTASVDLAVCALALTHLSELAPALSELARVLRPRGELIVSELHPLVQQLGGGALFFDTKGAAAVRSYCHPLGGYLNAFRQAGLETLECVEPVVQPDDLPAVAGGLLSAAEQAFRSAYTGLPYALVFRLGKRAGN